MDNMYQYKECGLDNIWLVNGFTVTEEGSRRAVAIEDVEGLHQAIGTWLALHKKTLDGREARYLRMEMGFSQATLAHLLGKNEQSIARWEKKKSGKNEKIPPDSERMIRALYLETVGHDTPLKDFLQWLADLEDVDPNPRTFSETENGWEQADAA